MKYEAEINKYLNTISILLAAFSIYFSVQYGTKGLNATDKSIELAEVSIEQGVASLEYAKEATAQLRSEHIKILELISESQNEHRELIKLVQENREISQYEHAALKENINEIH